MQTSAYQSWTARHTFTCFILAHYVQTISPKCSSMLDTHRNDSIHRYIEHVISHKLENPGTAVRGEGGGISSQIGCPTLSLACVLFYIYACESFILHLTYWLGRAWASPTLAWQHCRSVCVSMLACLDWPLTINFKWAHSNISRPRRLSYTSAKLKPWEWAWRATARL